MISYDDVIYVTSSNPLNSGKLNMFLIETTFTFFSVRLFSNHPPRKNFVLERSRSFHLFLQLLSWAKELCRHPAPGKPVSPKNAWQARNPWAFLHRGWLSHPSEKYLSTWIISPRMGWNHGGLNHIHGIISAMIYLWSVWYQIVVYIVSFPALSRSLSLSLFISMFPMCFACLSTAITWF